MSPSRKRAAYEPGTALLQPTPRDPHMRRPITTITGAALVLLRTVIGLVSIVVAALNGDLRAVDDAGLPSDEARWVALAVVGTVLAVQLIFGILILTGHNVARVVVMLIATVDITTSFVGWVERGGFLRLETAPYTLALDVLVLLALSSRSAAAYARRNQPGAPRAAAGSAAARSDGGAAL